MDKLTLVFRTDVHASDHAPASWKGDYREEILESLRQIGVIADSVGAVGVLDGGDFFHVKAPTRTSHGLIIDVGHIHKDYPCPVYAIEGNHDLQGNNLETIDRQPLGVLFECGVFRRLREEIFIEGEVRVRVVGVPFSPTRTLQELQTIRKRSDDMFLVVVAHALAGEAPPPSVEGFFKEPVFHYQDLVFDDGPDAWCFGHWHKDQGITRVGGKLFINQGAVGRGALIKENTERTPQVSILEVTLDAVTARSVNLNVAPATEVFDFERKTRIDEQSQSVDQFVTELTKAAQFDAEVSIEDNVRSLDFAAEVRSVALEYLERARSEVK